MMEAAQQNSSVIKNNNNSSSKTTNHQAANSRVQGAINEHQGMYLVPVPGNQVAWMQILPPVILNENDLLTAVATGIIEVLPGTRYPSTTL